MIYQPLRLGHKSANARFVHNIVNFLSHRIPAVVCFVLLQSQFLTRASDTRGFMSSGNGWIPLIDSGLFDSRLDCTLAASLKERPNRRESLDIAWAKSILLRIRMRRY